MASRCQCIPASHISLISDSTHSVSPSIYVAYRDLRASYVCPSFSGFITRGRAYNTTIAYKPGVLSTSLCTDTQFDFNNGYSGLNLTQMQHTTSYNGTCTILDVLQEHTTNGPYLGLPQDLNLLDPEWTTCSAALWGAFDPPIALQPATALIQPPSKPTPAPGSPIAPPHAPATPTSPLIDAGRPATHSATPKADPQDPEQQDPQSVRPVQSAANIPKPDVHDPGRQSSDSADSPQPSAHDEHDDPTNSAFTPLVPNVGNVAQGDPQKASKHEFTDHQTINDPGRNNPAPLSNVAPADPAKSNSLPNNPATSQASKADPPADSPSDPKALPVPGDFSGDPDEPSSNSPGSSPDGLQPSSANPKRPVDPKPQQGGNSQVQAQGLGGDIYNTFGRLGPGKSRTDDYTDIGDTWPMTLDTLTVASQKIVLDSSGIIIGGSTLVPGGKAVTISNTPISLLSSSGLLVVGSSTIFLPPQPAPQPTHLATTQVLTVGGQIFTANPSAFPIAGTTLVSAGGPAVTISGTAVSLGPSGVLAIGSSTTITLLPPSKPSPTTADQPPSTRRPTISLPPPGPSTAHVDGFDVINIAPSSAVLIDGATLRPGAPGVTISGKVVGLESGGSTLDIGTGRFALPKVS